MLNFSFKKKKTTLNVIEYILDFDSGNHFRTLSLSFFFFDNVLALFRTTSALLCYLLNKIQPLRKLLLGT